MAKAGRNNDDLYRRSFGTWYFKYRVPAEAGQKKLPGRRVMPKRAAVRRG